MKALRISSMRGMCPFERSRESMEALEALKANTLSRLRSKGLSHTLSLIWSNRYIITTKVD
jgi:hypothetical protein